MKLIDAIEGTAKSIIAQLHQVFIQENLDDSEYVRSVKAVIEGTDLFAGENKAVVEDAQVLKEVLYAFSKEIWHRHLLEVLKEEAAASDEAFSPNDDGYYEYYYDYLYRNGVYPP